MRQQERRRTPYPLTWEPPVAGLLVVTVGLVVGVHLGRALALVVAGVGWRWPVPALLFRSVPGVLAGDAAAGLAVPVPPVAALAVWVTVAELVVLAVLATAGVLVVRRWGPGRLRGTASAAECAALLGRARLWRARRIIRPDVYGTASSGGRR